MVWATFVSQKVWIYLQSHLRGAPESYDFAEMTQNNGHYAVQGHSRSPILVPIEISYATSY